MQIKRHKDDHFWVEATRLFARTMRIDNDTVDRAIRLFLTRENLDWPKFHLRTFMQWNNTRGSVRRSLQEVVQGENPDIVRLAAKVKEVVTAESYGEYFRWHSQRLWNDPENLITDARYRLAELFLINTVHYR